MTLKQQLVIKSLPENNFNIGKSMRENGYTKQGSRAGSNYASLRKAIKKEFKLDEIDEKWIIDRITKEASKVKNKSSDKLKALELLAKWKALLTDKSKVDFNDVSAQEKGIIDRYIHQNHTTCSE